MVFLPIIMTPMNILSIIFINRNLYKALFLLQWLFISVITAWARNKTIPGKTITPYPTILNLAVEWAIQGDDNLNGVVTVLFRERIMCPMKTLS